MYYLLGAIIVLQLITLYKLFFINGRKKRWKDDKLFEEAKKLVQETGKASASLLQRRLSIGYARSAMLLDMLEDKGIVSPANGAKPRNVLIKKEDL